MYTPLLQMLNPAAQTAAASSSASSSSTTASATNPGVDLTNTFLHLLTVQLKNQSPLNPLDPNAFITQLAQFDSLGELTQIQQLMQTLVNDVTPTTNPISGAANARANSTSSPSPNISSH